MARPKVYDPEEVAARLEKYCKMEENPIIKGFCIQDGNPCHDTLCTLSKDCKSLSEAMKKCIAKQEVFYERNMNGGQIPPAFAIFKLKQPQHGWTDKMTTELTGKDGEPIKQSIDLTLIPLNEIEKELKKLESI